VQQGENKGRWKELTEQADSQEFSFFLNFPWNFAKGTSRNQFFLFSLFFIFFSEQGSKKDATTKICTYN
jgi:hypothetical protein